MCIRDSSNIDEPGLEMIEILRQLYPHVEIAGVGMAQSAGCLLYTSDAADERSSVDLGGRRIIKKKKQRHQQCRRICKNTDMTTLSV